MNKIEDNHRHSITDEEVKIIDDSFIVKCGLSNTWIKNQKYKQLVIEIILDSLLDEKYGWIC